MKPGMNIEVELKEGCRFCNPNHKKSAILQDAVTLQIFQDGEDYVEIELLTGGDNEPSIAAQCRMNNLVARNRVHINYCPMCGTRLKF